MKYLFYLGHPAHYHLFKNTINILKENGHIIYVLIKSKDVLAELLRRDKIEYYNILPKGRKDSKTGIAIGQFKQDFKLLGFCLKNRPDLLLGSTVSIAHVGKMLGISSINFSEDDAKAVYLFARITYPFSTVILTPDTCDNDKWEYKSIRYKGYKWTSL